jgi:hypothetical protein
MTVTQVYISYARDDDIASPGFKHGRKGFVSALHEQLRYEIQTRGYSELKLFLGREPVVDNLQSNIEMAISESSFMIVVLSPNWMASEYCRRELYSFLSRWKHESKLNPVNRIVVVGKRHVDPGDRPLPLRGQLGYNFYSISDRDNLNEEQAFFADGEFVDTRSAALIASIVNVLIGLSKRKITDLAQPRAKTSSEKQGVSSSPAAGSQTRPSPSVADKSPASLDLSRASAVYWLRRVDMERRLAAGDEPLVMVSFAAADQAWVDELHAFLEPRLEDLRDVGEAPYQLWNFTSAKRGTVPGDDFPEIVAEKMWRCRVAIIFLSKDYFRSAYCRKIELPFLMWRWEHHKVMCFPIRLGTAPIDKVEIPEYQGVAKKINLNDIIDDRQATEGFATSPYRNHNMKELKEARLEAEIEKRFDGVARRVVDFLKKRHNASDGS